MTVHKLEAATSTVESKKVALLHSELQHKFVPRLQYPTQILKQLNYLG